MKAKLGLMAVAILLMPLALSAAVVRYGEQTSTATSERMTEDTYIVGGTVSSAAAVTGDLIAAGGNVLINGAVSQDLIVGGGSVTVLGTVGDDLRIGGGNVLVNSRVTGDLIAGGGQLQISGTGIGGDVLAGAGTMRLEAPVTGDVTIGGGEAYINARVGGNVIYKGGKLTLGPAAVIAGNLTYSAPAEATIESGATVAGETAYTPMEKQLSKGAIAGIFSVTLLLKFLMMFVAALVLGLFFRRYALTIIDSVVNRPLPELGRGFATLVLVPIASVILLVTVIGIPLGILGLIGYVGLLMLACISSVIVLGSIVHRWATKSAVYHVTWLTVLIGAVLYTIIGIIPFIGDLALFILALIVMGSIVKMKWDLVRTWR